MGPRGVGMLSDGLKQAGTGDSLGLLACCEPLSHIRASAHACLRAPCTYTGLRTLLLGQNSIGPGGASVLAEVLRVNTTLVSLDLTDNGIGTCECLIERVRALWCVFVCGCANNGIGACVWATDVLGWVCMYTRCVRGLSISCLPSFLPSFHLFRPGKEGAFFLGEALADHPTLTELNLRDNHLGSGTVQATTYNARAFTPLTGDERAGI